MIKRFLILMLLCGNCWALDWFEIQDNPGSWSSGQRYSVLRVPTGWIFKSMGSTNMIFIYDPDHRWKPA